MRHSVCSLPPSPTSLRMPYDRVKSQFLPALPRPRPVNGYSETPSKLIIREMSVLPIWQSLVRVVPPFLAARWHVPLKPSMTLIQIYKW
jgi:hypothetical protein